MKLIYFLLSVILLPNFLYAYEEIFEVCDRYERSFAVLNMNAGDGELGFLLAEKYPHAVIVMSEQDIGIQNKRASALAQKCRERKDLKNIVVISAQINVSDAEDLARCEHFDLVICSKDPRDMLLPKDVTEDHIVNLMKEIATHAFIVNHEIAKCENSRIEKNCLYRGSYQRLGFEQTYKYRQSFRKCPRTNEYHGITICPGVSLISYIAYRGIWPELEVVEQFLSNPKVKEAHKNATPWNVIISGERINFNRPSNERAKENLVGPSLWEIEDEFFRTKSKRAMRELIKRHYLD